MENIVIYDSSDGEGLDSENDYGVESASLVPDEESHSADAPLERPCPRKRPRMKREFPYSVILGDHTYHWTHDSKSSEDPKRFYRCNTYQVGSRRSEWVTRAQARLRARGPRSERCKGTLWCLVADGGQPIYVPDQSHDCVGQEIDVPICDDWRPPFTMISPPSTFFERAQPYYDPLLEMLQHPKTEWTSISTAQGSRNFLPKLSEARGGSHMHLLHRMIQEKLRPYLGLVRKTHPKLIHVKVGALQTQVGARSQFDTFGHKLHSDYPDEMNLLPVDERPVSLIVAIDPFDFEILPTRAMDSITDRVRLTVPAGFAILFTNMCLHGGGANTSGKVVYRLFAYIVSQQAHIPLNHVYTERAETVEPVVERVSTRTQRSKRIVWLPDRLGQEK